MPDRPRPSRRHTVAAVAAAVLTGALVAPTAGYAGLDLPFSDVPESHPYFEEIRWLYSAGVVTGYPDGTYKPTQAVSRQSMAAYLYRFADLMPSVAWDGWTAYITVPESTTYETIPGVSVTFTVPEGIDVESKVVARFSAESRCSGVSGFASVRLLLDGVEMGPAVANDMAFDSSDNGTESASSWESHAMERYAIAGSGVHTITVQARRSHLDLQCLLDDGALVVESFPLV